MPRITSTELTGTDSTTDAGTDSRTEASGASEPVTTTESAVDATGALTTGADPGRRGGSSTVETTAAVATVAIATATGPNQPGHADEGAAAAGPGIGSGIGSGM